MDPPVNMVQVQVCVLTLLVLVSCVAGFPTLGLEGRDQQAVPAVWEAIDIIHSAGNPMMASKVKLNEPGDDQARAKRGVTVTKSCTVRVNGEGLTVRVKC